MTLRKLNIDTGIEEKVSKHSVKSTGKNGHCSHKLSSNVLISLEETFFGQWVVAHRLLLTF